MSKIETTTELDKKSVADLFQSNKAKMFQLSTIAARRLAWTASALGPKLVAL